ncbi:hypothetical protein MHK_007085 [Candidatus Magnetomorum sp. HK-1]|nr:hypothetical protein MHK_007085 [Candidatus Magnetomorum sp. HK-1]
MFGATSRSPHLKKDPLIEGLTHNLNLVCPSPIGKSKYDNIRYALSNHLLSGTFALIIAKNLYYQGKLSWQYKHLS